MVEFKFCPDHKCLKEKVELLKGEKNFWHRIFDSVWVKWGITSLAAVVLAFNVWIVKEIYAQKANEKENKKATEIISDNMKETKESIKDIKEEIKKDNEKRSEQRVADQEKLMKVLLDIQKQIKK